jgi:hypothetical protein
LLDGEQLVTNPAAERLDVGVLPRTAGVDVARAGSGEAAPVLQRVRGHLGAVVAAHELRRAATCPGQPFKDIDGRVRVDAPRALDLQGLAGELVDDVQQLQDVPVSGLVELEVKRPYMIRALCPQPFGWDRGVPEALALSAALRDPQALLAPDALHPLTVDHPTLNEQLGMRPAIPPPRPLARKPAKARPERRIVLSEHRLTPLR